MRGFLPMMKCLVFAGCLCSAALGQADPYYMSDGDGRKIIVVQGGAIIDTFAAVPDMRAFPIAVVDTVRTTGYSPGEIGGEYQLDGTPTGVQYPLNQGQNMSDGTTDGVEFNYGIEFTGANVWRYDRNWANGVPIFSAPGYGGIAYDPTDSTFWLSGDRRAGISHYDLSGNLLGSFNTVGNLDWNLALEPSTGTLWVSPFRINTLYNYAKDGTLLGQVTVPGMTASSFFSGEFVFAAGGKCVYTISKSKSKGGCEACPRPGSNFETEQGCKDVSDCRKKVKTTISCPDGQGSCKLKGKRSACS